MNNSHIVISTWEEYIRINNWLYSFSSIVQQLLKNILNLKRNIIHHSIYIIFLNFITLFIIFTLDEWRNCYTKKYLNVFNCNKNLQININNIFKINNC